MSVEKLLNELKSRAPRQVLDAQLGKLYEDEQVHLARTLGIDKPQISNLFTYINQAFGELKIAAILTDEEIEELLLLFKEQDREIKVLHAAYDSLLVQAAEKVKK